MIFVNDLVSSSGITHNILDHFQFTLWDSYNDDWLMIDNPTADDYIFLCDREVNQWAISEDGSKMEIYLAMEDEDHHRFKNARTFI